MYIFLVTVIFIVIAVVFWLRFSYLSGNLNQIVYDHGGLIPEDIQKEWENLSWNRLPGGAQPLRVIKLAGLMVADESRFRECLHMTSSYYSQVKYLVKMGRFPTALVFLIKAKSLARSALECRKDVLLDKRRPIDLEVLGAPDFMLASIPIIGRFWKKSALEFLNAADAELEEVFKQPGTVRPEPIAAGLIWSKLYALTGNEYYKNRVRIAELTKDHDINQMKRIAKHLGFKTLEEFDQFLAI